MKRISYRDIRVQDTSPPLIPYVRQTLDYAEWRALATPKWYDLGLPDPQDPPEDAEPCFIRWGDKPEGGRSFNHQLGEYERGMAVFKAYRTTGFFGDVYHVDLERSVTLAILYIRLSTSGRTLYRASGEVCGAGDGG